MCIYNIKSYTSNVNCTRKYWNTKRFMRTFASSSHHVSGIKLLQILFFMGTNLLQGRKDGTFVYIYLFLCETPNFFLSFYSLLLPVNHITLSFTDFDIENNRRNCTTDFVEILDGNNYEAPLRGIVLFPCLFHMWNHTQGEQEKVFCECPPVSWIFSDKGSSLSSLARGVWGWRLSFQCEWHSPPRLQLYSYWPAVWSWLQLPFPCSLAEQYQEPSNSV